MTGSDTERNENGAYHVTEDGTKWPNCLTCGSEDTAVVPATGEWTCEDCGHQWHSDETSIDDGDAGAIGGEIGELIESLAKESPAELADLAQERGVHPHGDQQ